MSLLTDPVFWVSIATLVTAAYRFSLSQAYKSKCERFNICWGMVSVQRNVTIEGHIDEHAIDVGNQEEKEDI
jgi:hypothetical protein